jgi:hypothetical protein
MSSHHNQETLPILALCLWLLGKTVERELQPTAPEQVQVCSVVGEAAVTQTWALV